MPDPVFGATTRKFKFINDLGFGKNLNERMHREIFLTVILIYTKLSICTDIKCICNFVLITEISLYEEFSRNTIIGSVGI